MIRVRHIAGGQIPGHYSDTVRQNAICRISLLQSGMEMSRLTRCESLLLCSALFEVDRTLPNRIDKQLWHFVPFRAHDYTDC